MIEETTTQEVVDIGINAPEVVGPIYKCLKCGAKVERFTTVLCDKCVKEELSPA